VNYTVDRMIKPVVPTPIKPSRRRRCVRCWELDVIRKGLYICEECEGEVCGSRDVPV